MREQDLLIQRFLDDDLTPEERVAFLQTVDADPSLRRRWLNLELVVAEAAQLPRLAPSARFLAQVQGKLAIERSSLWDRLRAMITVPRTLEWNFAGAVAAACCGGGGGRRPVAVCAGTDRGSAGAGCRESGADGVVRARTREQGVCAAHAASARCPVCFGGRRLQWLESWPDQVGTVRGGDMDGDDRTEAGPVSVHVRH